MGSQNELRLQTHLGLIPVATQEARPEAGTKALRIIVADDSSTFIEVVCALLELDGKVDIVARARDGLAAIEATAKLRPDLLLMDISMPRLDGLSAALIIASQLPGTRIVLMSAEETPTIRADVQVYGAEGFIYKPCFRDEFRAALGLQ